MVEIIELPNRQLLTKNLLSPLTIGCQEGNANSQPFLYLLTQLPCGIWLLSKVAKSYKRHGNALPTHTLVGWLFFFFCWGGAQPCPSSEAFFCLFLFKSNQTHLPTTLPLLLLTCQPTYLLKKLTKVVVPLAIDEGVTICTRLVFAWAFHLSTYAPRSWCCQQHMKVLHTPPSPSPSPPSSEALLLPVYENTWNNIHVGIASYYVP
jgi:hypothetical protein